MARTTIDFGIDLGTTNSVIALTDGVTTEVIPNQEGAFLTPSAVHINHRGRLFVGRQAKERAFLDKTNTAVEFKLQMGGDPGQTAKTFVESGRIMTPEDLSAEVLKALKEDVRVGKNEEVLGAVITIPAAFLQPQSDATRKAAELAGFQTCHLLQEPVAAALAYGFQSKSERAFWLVYDFGGGTFDAAVVSVRDGMIQVVNHAGDNFLGGKNIDWDIVEKLLIPAVEKEFGLSGVSRSNPDWSALTVVLKQEAEKAKIQVSRTRRPFQLDLVDLWIGGGEKGDLQFTLTPAHLQELLRPWIAQSIALSRQALQEKNMSGKDLEKVIMVGGSSLFPWVQEAVSEAIGAPVDLSIDPMTVVARGAAIFASTRPLTLARESIPEGTFSIELTYDPVGPEVDPLVGGKVVAPRGGPLAGYTLVVTETKTKWTSGKITLGENGLFHTEIHAEKGRRCEYVLALADPRGNSVPCAPDRFSYTVGLAINGMPLSYSVGVRLQGNRSGLWFRKGEVVPVKRTLTSTTTAVLKKGDSENPLRIPVFEGENELKADRNRMIGELKIFGNDPLISRDLPAGTEVEVTLEIDGSLKIKATAYINLIDAAFQKVLDLHFSSADPVLLQEELKVERGRLEDLKRQAQSRNDSGAGEELKKIEEQDLVRQTQATVAAAQGDPDARVEADRKILNFRNAVDRVEDHLAWPKLVAQAEEALGETREVVEEYGDRSHRQLLQELQARLLDAVSNKDAKTLQAIFDRLEELKWHVLQEQPQHWVGLLGWLKDRQPSMTDPQQADRLFRQGDKAVQANDLTGLRGAVRQLVHLLPPDQQEEAGERGIFLR